VEVAASRSEGGTRVRVADDGPGIDAATLETLFERFARGNGEAGAGFGLGLPIAREIAKAHGGTIEVESEVGTGTVFRVWLPEAPPGEGDR
jgi:signal transduction histidine kinase